MVGEPAYRRLEPGPGELTGSRHSCQSRSSSSTVVGNSVRLLLAGRMVECQVDSTVALLDSQWWREVPCNVYQMAWAALGATLYCSKRWSAVNVSHLLPLSANGCS